MASAARQGMPSSFAMGPQRSDLSLGWGDCQWLGGLAVGEWGGRGEGLAS